MSVKFPDSWAPNGPFGIVDAADLKGGFQSVADATERDAIPVGKQSKGMMIFQVDTRVLYRVTTSDGSHTVPATVQEVMTLPGENDIRVNKIQLLENSKQINFGDSIADGLDRQLQESVALTTATGGAQRSGTTPAYLEDTGQSWTVDEFTGQTLAILGGTGDTQIRKIVKNTATRLYVAGPWETIPDATSQYEVIKWRMVMRGKNVQETEVEDPQLSDIMTGSLNFPVQDDGANELAGIIGWGLNDTDGGGPIAVDFAERSGTVRRRSTIIDNARVFDIKKKDGDLTCYLDMSIDASNRLEFSAIQARAWAGFYDGLSQGSAQRSQVLTGCACEPYTVRDGGATNAAAGFRVDDGAVLFPNGDVGIISSAMSETFTDPTGGFVKNSSISEHTGWTDPAGGGGLGYFYCYVYRDTVSENLTLGFDTQPPDAYGRPTSIHGSWPGNVADTDAFAFLGTLTVFDAVVSVQSSTARERHLAFEQGAHVVNYGNGIRSYGVANSHLDTSDYVELIQQVGATTAETRYSLLDSALLISNPGFRRARALGMSLNGHLVQSSSGVGSYALHGPGFVHHDNIPSVSGKNRHSIDFRVPVVQDPQQPPQLIILPDGTLSYEMEMRATVHTIYENVNDLTVGPFHVDAAF